MLVQIEVSETLTIHIGHEDIVHYVDVLDGPNYKLVTDEDTPPLEDAMLCELGVHYAPRENMGPFWISSMDDGSYDEEYGVGDLITLLSELECPLPLGGASLDQIDDNDTCGITMDTTEELESPKNRAYEIFGVAVGPATVIAYVKTGDIVVSFESNIEWEEPDLAVDIAIPTRCIIKGGILMPEGSSQDKWYNVDSREKFDVAIIKMMTLELSVSPNSFRDMYKISEAGQKMMIETIESDTTGAFNVS